MKTKSKVAGAMDQTMKTVVVRILTIVFGLAVPGGIRAEQAITVNGVPIVFEDVVGTGQPKARILYDKGVAFPNIDYTAGYRGLRFLWNASYTRDVNGNTIDRVFDNELHSWVQMQMENEWRDTSSGWMQNEFNYADSGYRWFAAITRIGTKITEVALGNPGIFITANDHGLPPAPTSPSAFYYATTTSSSLVTTYYTNNWRVRLRAGMRLTNGDGSGNAADGFITNNVVVTDLLNGANAGTGIDDGRHFHVSIAAASTVFDKIGTLHQPIQIVLPSNPDGMAQMDSVPPTGNQTFYAERADGGSPPYKFKLREIGNFTPVNIATGYNSLISGKDNGKGSWLRNDNSEYDGQVGISHPGYFFKPAGSTMISTPVLSVLGEEGAVDWTTLLVRGRNNALTSTSAIAGARLALRTVDQAEAVVQDWSIGVGVSTNYSIEASNRLRIFTPTSFIMTMTPTGRIGIGSHTSAAADPSGKLHVDAGTLTNDLPLIKSAAVWSNNSETFTGWLLDINAANSNQDSKLIDVRADNKTLFAVRRSGLAIKRTSTGGDYTAVAGDDLIAVTNTSAARTVTLPAATSVGASVDQVKTLRIKDEGGQAGTNTLTIARSASDTIDGATSATINTNYGSRTFYSNGTAWFSLD